MVSGRGALGAPASAEALPELARVHWRPRASDQTLTRAARLWTLTTVVHTVPFVLAALVLAALLPVIIPVALILLAHAWAIPEIYAARGAAVLRRRAGPSDPAERAALGFLGDLVDHRRRELYARTGLVLERGRLGTWAGWRPRRPAGSARGTQGQLLLREDDRPGAAAERPRRPPAAGAANRRDRLRHGRKPGVLGRPLACAPAPGPEAREALDRRGAGRAAHPGFWSLYVGPM